MALSRHAAGCVRRLRQRQHLGCPVVRAASTVAYQGVPGAFSEAAVREYFAGDALSTVGVETFAKVFDGIISGDFSAGVVPIEDSMTGTFHSVYDLLLERPSLHIVGEHASITEHCLCTVPGGRMDAIAKVSSNPEILRQCRTFLDKLSVRRRERGDAALSWVPGLNSAQCAMDLSTSGAADMAVICSKTAAELYGLTVVKGGSSIADTNLSTRYLVVSKEPSELALGERMKSSIVFGLPNEPMALFKAISCFALRGISISKIESRPASAVGDRLQRAYHWDYVFYMDLELPARHGGVAVVDALDAALENLSEFSISVRELGRYVQNLGKERAYYTLDIEDLAR